MLYLAICTEGENSEPAFISELNRVVRGQSVNQKGVNIAIVTIPLKGVHGHSKIVEAADSALEMQKASDGLLGEFHTGDELEKWLICDYDYMERHGIELSEFRRMVISAGYHLIINRPNFEFFVLALLGGLDIATEEAPSNYEDAINSAVKKINEANRADKGFSEAMFIPKYTKKRYAVQNFFGKLLDYNPELLNQFCNINFDTTLGCFSEMAAIINRIKNLNS